MRRPTRTAISALTRLDPLRSADPGYGAPIHDPAEAIIELQIARILAMPRGDARIERRTFGLRMQTAAHRNRPRYGAVGLVASAAIAVIATVLWVSPSAGAPTTQASRAPAPITESRTAASVSPTGDPMTDKRSLSAVSAAVFVR
jgi:hypothetical protein